MKKNDSDFHARVQRLLRAAQPAYPAGMDWKLQLKLRQAQAAEPAPAFTPFRVWPRVIGAIAMIMVVIVAGLYWRRVHTVNTFPEPPRRALAVIDLAQYAPQFAVKKDAAVWVPGTTSVSAAATRVKRTQAVPPQQMRMQFVIPDKNITIIWQQNSDFDLQPLMQTEGE